MVERKQPVVPVALRTVRSRPPTNEPHGIFAVFKRSPMFGADDWAVPLVGSVVEHTSPAGSISPISVKLSWRSFSRFGLGLVLAPSTCVQPLVVPANMLIAPGVE